MFHAENITLCAELTSQTDFMITAMLKTPTSFFTVRSSLWRVSASKTQHKQTHHCTFSPHTLIRTTSRRWARLEAVRVLYLFLFLLPPAIIVVMGPVSSLRPPLSWALLVHWQAHHDSTFSHARLLKTHAPLSVPAQSVSTSTSAGWRDRFFSQQNIIIF